VDKERSFRQETATELFNAYVARLSMETITHHIQIKPDCDLETDTKAPATEAFTS